MRLSKFACGLMLGALPTVAGATTYTVGPSGRQYTQLSVLFEQVDLAPGDVVLVDGNATYSGDIVVGSDDGGSANQPVTIRWSRGAGQARPKLAGGFHTIKFERANHVVFEGFEVAGGSRSCIFSEAHDIVVRDAYVHDCPAHGILGADRNSGSFTLEYSEVARAGAGDSRHAIYMQSDEIAYPGSVFRMRYNYVHDATGGVLVRVRHERAEIHYNWIEGSYLHEVELIGPDCETQGPGWSADLYREDAELVGNVIVHDARSSSGNALRIGGDLNGRNQGRVRLVNNTILFLRGGGVTAVQVQLGQGSLEMHNNAIYQLPTGVPAVVRERTAGEVQAPFCGPNGREPWAAGRKVAGSGNWVQRSAVAVPVEWIGTARGDDPGFSSAARLQLRPRVGSPLLGTANPQPGTQAAFPFPEPMGLPRAEPPLRRKPVLGEAHLRTSPWGRVSIGALEP